jgi:hypothetical protein
MILMRDFGVAFSLYAHLQQTATYKWPNVVTHEWPDELTHELARFLTREGFQLQPEEQHGADSVGKTGAEDEGARRLFASHNEEETWWQAA